VVPESDCAGLFSRNGFTPSGGCLARVGVLSVLMDVPFSSMLLITVF